MSILLDLREERAENRLTRRNRNYAMPWVWIASEGREASDREMTRRSLLVTGVEGGGELRRAGCWVL